MTTIAPRHPRARRSGSFLLPLEPDNAFPLFTAEGERAWVPGWSPDVLGTGEQQPGLVFLTDHGGEPTIWTVIETDRKLLRHKYSRVTPGARAGTVEVRLSPEGPLCRVNVSYDMTALPEAGEVALAPYSAEAFRHMLDEWKALIEGWLVSHAGTAEQAGGGDR